jgi:hypothetical protein
MGLPLIAAATGLALWATGSVAADVLPKPSGVVVSADKLSAAPASVVGVSIPSVVFGSVDGLPKRLTSGTYQALFDVWLAAESPRSVATVRSSSGKVIGCAQVVLRAATVNKLHCTVVVGRGSATLTVATSVAGQRFHVAYAHRVS